jgi:hypothetical protein
MQTYTVTFSAFGRVKIVNVEAESMQDACIKAQPLLGYKLEVEPKNEPTIPLFDSGNPGLAREVDRMFGDGNIDRMFGEGK